VLLGRAASLGDCRGVLFLLHKGSLDVNSSDGAFNGETALIASSSRGHAQMVSVLLSVPASDVNSQTAWGGSALMGACCGGHERVVALLLSRRDLDVNATSMKGRTAFTFAVAYDRIGVVRLLMSDSRVQSSIAGSLLLPPLEVAVRGGFSHIVLQLVHSSLVTGYSGYLGWLHLLHHAVQQCHLGVVEVLTSFFVSMRASGDLSVVDGICPVATLRGSILLSMRFGLPSSCSVMKYLLEHWQCDPTVGAPDCGCGCAQ
jgi:ankyrin repeat protein